MKLTSSFCRHTELASSDFQRWISEMGRAVHRPHRKDWELAFIAETLWQRGMFGKRGLVFGVGVEPLPALLVNHGCRITASDHPEACPEWVGQHAARLDVLERISTLNAEQRERIDFIPVDMRAIPEVLHGQFDFVWSTSSMEHLGSLAEAERFVSESLKCLRPGGIAIHITELSVFPLEPMPDERGTVFFTVERIQELLKRLDGEPLRCDFGDRPADYYADHPPYKGASHLKLSVDGVVTTSVALVFRKAKPRRSLIYTVALGPQYEAMAGLLESSLRDHGYTGDFRVYKEMPPMPDRINTKREVMARLVIGVGMADESYDVVMHLDADTLVINSVEPLLDLAQNSDEVMRFTEKEITPANRSSFLPDSVSLNIARGFNGGAFAGKPFIVSQHCRALLWACAEQNAGYMPCQDQNVLNALVATNAMFVREWPLKWATFVNDGSEPITDATIVMHFIGDPATRVSYMRRVLEMTRAPRVFDGPWYLSSAVEFITSLQAEANKRGYFLSLGGSVLNRGYSNKDLDVTCTPSPTPAAVADAFVTFSAWLKEKYGEPSISHEWNERMWKYTFDLADGRRVDWFVVR